jgi:hypothetical protein
MRILYVLMVVVFLFLFRKKTGSKSIDKRQGKQKEKNLFTQNTIKYGTSSKDAERPCN